jgi:hypothetical protein
MLPSWPRRVLLANSSRGNGPKYNEGHDLIGVMEGGDVKVYVRAPQRLVGT